MTRMLSSFVIACTAGRAASALPSLPSEFTLEITAWAECGSGSGGTCGNETRTQYTMAERVAEVTSKGWHQLVAGDEGKKYRWTDGDDDCSVDDYKYPAQPDWAWLAYNTTTDDGVVPCPDWKAGTAGPAKCQLYSGPWPEQLTVLAQLYLRQDADADGRGAYSVPHALSMQCGIFPFTIYKTYGKLTPGAPPNATVTPDKSCPQRAARDATTRPPTAGAAARGMGVYGRSAV